MITQLAAPCSFGHQIRAVPPCRQIIACKWKQQCHMRCPTSISIVHAIVFISRTVVCEPKTPSRPVLLSSLVLCIDNMRLFMPSDDSALNGDSIFGSSHRSLSSAVIKALLWAVFKKLACPSYYIVTGCFSKAKLIYLSYLWGQHFSIVPNQVISVVRLMPLSSCARCPTFTDHPLRHHSFQSSLIICVRPFCAILSTPYHINLDSNMPGQWLTQSCLQFPEHILKYLILSIYLFLTTLPHIADLYSVILAYIRW